MILLAKYTALKGGNVNARYSYNPLDRTYELSPSSEPYQTFCQGCAGYADEREIGCLHKRRVFVAFFLDGNKLTLNVGKDSFSWTDVPGELTVKRGTIFPGIRYFQIRKGKDTRLKFSYQFSYDDDFPGPLVEDIFMFIEERLSSHKEFVRTVLWFQAWIEGKDTSVADFLHDVDKKLNEL